MIEEQLAGQEKTLSDKIGEFLEKEGFKNAVVVAEHPELDSPIIFWNCHFYDGAKLCADAHRAFREQIAKDIS